MCCRYDEMKKAIAKAGRSAAARPKPLAKVCMHL